ncbi:MAG: M4 family metallopeptidase, partial [Candidatus Roizmanbacteria bacterium]
MNIWKLLSSNTYLRAVSAGVLVYGVAIVMIISFSVTTAGPKDRTTKAQEAVPSVLPVTEDSSTTIDGNIVHSDVTIPKTNTISSDQDALGGAFEIMQKLEKTKIVNSEDESGNRQVKGASTEGLETTSALPADFTKNAKLIRTLDESKAYPEIAQKNVKHYYFQQQIKVGSESVPVLGAEVRMGLKEEGGSSDLVSMGINTVQETKNVVTGSFVESQAQSEAIKLAKNDNEGAFSLDICSGKMPEKVIVNQKLIGYSDDSRNIISYKIPVCASSSENLFEQEYYVSAETGKVLMSFSNVYTAKNRVINDCSSGRCALARDENHQTGGTGDVGPAFDYSGESYDFFKNNYNRDGYDNRGGKTVGNVNYIGVLPDGTRCPNALSSGGRSLYFCRGEVTKDIWGHELAHSVTAHTAGLKYQDQSGALNEGFSDIFGWALDQDDWEMTGVRRMDDPPRKGQPDRLFSSRFYCGAGDTGGVHINSGVLNKSFYLMVEGGTFNGCTLAKSDSKKVLDVMYKALTTYLRPFSNFRDAYDKINQACNDLNGQSSAECQNIMRAMQATEMDKQTATTQRAPICTGQTSSSAASCAGGGGGTGSPAPTSSSPNPTNVIEPTSRVAPTVRPTLVITPPNAGTGVSTPVPSIRTQQNVSTVRSIDGITVCTSSTVPNGSMKVEVTCNTGEKFFLESTECKRISDYKVEAETRCAAFSRPGGPNT